jgi:hypothetical protein
LTRRAKAILDMVKDKPANPVTTYASNQNTQNLRTPNLDYVDSIYRRDYSMTSSIFDTFCESQTTYNSHHLASLNTNKLKEALLNKSTTDCTIKKHRNTPTPHIEVNLTCNESMPTDSPLDLPLEAHQKINLTCDSPHDYDSDDSVRDKDYNNCPSDSSSSSSKSDVSQEKNPKKKRRRNTNMSTDVTKQLTFNHNNGAQILKRGRRCFVGAIRCEKTMPERPTLRKRSNTVDGNYYCMLSADNELKKKDIPSKKKSLERHRRKSIGPI